MDDEGASTSSASDSETQHHESAAAEHGLESVKRKLCRLVASSLSVTVPGLDVEPMLEVSKPGFGDYQCNNALSLFSSLRGTGTNFQNPRSIGQTILNNLPSSDIVESTSVAGPGYVNIVISSDWIAKMIQDMLIYGIKTWAPTMPVNRVIVDFSSPNIAKEMHVGHIRSTIIGDALARMLEFANVEVLRRNHVGDWGTQFGMLIEFLFEQFPNWKEVGNQAIEDLQSFYKASKIKFDDESSGFKAKAKQAVVRLQQGEDRYRAAWEKICQISHNEFDSVYKRLGVELEEKAASMAGWLPDQNEKEYPKTTHVGFGLVLGLDGKRFRTRCSEVVRLVDLLDEAKSRCKEELIGRLTENGKIADWTVDELDTTSEAIGLGAVKYADLKNNRLTDYTFSFDKMLSDKGNTAVYLQYAHARICSIIRKANKDIEELKTKASITFVHADERALGLHVIRFQEVVEQACADLLPHYLCDYLYSLSEAFSKFYASCQVVGSPEEASRLLLCHATAVVMRQCFNLLGITPVYKL
ncbi:arginine--tRNA ligase, cytoplasmic-like isoform X2 [Panicum virgatum]|uniref:arginine--tRNA ligase, cytoplasmic-like isoform X2 n=1 Tax=Panicum virgatum TaxID=38727 RepID=UPI0019D5C8A5|nr:arginine--tRNA ligase, cytoplasmic-like isoform X2 [Panicum virgatum]